MMISKRVNGLFTEPRSYILIQLKSKDEEVAANIQREINWKNGCIEASSSDNLHEVFFDSHEVAIKMVQYINNNFSNYDAVASFMYTLPPKRTEPTT